MGKVEISKRACARLNGNLERPESTVHDEFTFEAELDVDVDDGLDPVMKEKLDREVEDFARRLNSGWPDRKHMQEYLAPSEEQGQILPMPLRIASISPRDSWGVETSNSSACQGIYGGYLHGYQKSCLPSYWD
eukprot:c28599_g1_i5 orf=493-891(-)